MPHKAYEGDAGFDVFAACKSLMIWPKTWEKIPLGFAMELEPGWVALIQGKSGYALKNGIFTIGNVIDSTYRGECHAILYNLGDQVFNVNCTQKVAQMLILPCYTGTKLETAVELSPSTRGAGGFGSTGTNVTTLKVDNLKIEVR